MLTQDVLPTNPTDNSDLSSVMYFTSIIDDLPDLEQIFIGICCKS